MIGWRIECDSTFLFLYKKMPTSRFVSKAVQSVALLAVIVAISGCYKFFSTEVVMCSEASSIVDRTIRN